MVRLYITALICAIICGAYFYGADIARAKCRADYLQTMLNQNENEQNEQRIIYETVIKTGAGDIRRILRDKYTIAD